MTRQRSNCIQFIHTQHHFYDAQAVTRFLSLESRAVFFLIKNVCKQINKLHRLTEQQEQTKQSVDAGARSIRDDIAVLQKEQGEIKQMMQTLMDVLTADDSSMYRGSAHNLATVTGGDRSYLFSNHVIT